MKRSTYSDGGQISSRGHNKGRIELTNGSFENVLHAPKLSINLLSVYQMPNSGTRKRFGFTLDVVDICDMQTNSKVSTGEVNH
jgi:hypothetical protein